MIALPPPLLDYVTVDDLVRAGACRDGVSKARDEIGDVTAVAVDPLLARLDGDEREWLQRASGRSGSGYGYYVSGHGHGSSYGYGYGDGSGSGSGYGYYGYGDGYGSSYGYYGYGDGYNTQEVQP